MKRIIIPLLALAACSRTTPIDEQHAAIVTQLDALESSLAPECKTQGITSQIDAIRIQVETEVSVCHASVAEERAEKNQAYLMFSIVSILLVLLGIKYLKK